MSNGLSRAEAQRHRRRSISGQYQKADWTPEDEKLFCALFPHTPNRDLVKIFGIQNQTVACWASMRGLKKAPGGTGRSVPLGTEHIDTYGYRLIKTGYRKWDRLHVVNWERVNGPIPYGHRLWFKDRNKQNCELENLELLTDAQNMARNSISNYPKPIKQAMIALSKLKKVINEKQD